MLLGGMVTEDVHSEVDAHRWIQAGTNDWRKVKASLRAETVSQQLKGNVLRAGVIYVWS